MDEQDQALRGVDPDAATAADEESVAAEGQTKGEGETETGEHTAAPLLTVKVEETDPNAEAVDGLSVMLTREQGDEIAEALGKETPDANGYISLGIVTDAYLSLEDRANGKLTEINLEFAGDPDDCFADVSRMVWVSPMDAAREELGGFMDEDVTLGKGDLEFDSELHERRKTKRQRRKKKKKAGTAFRVDRYTMRHATEMLEDLASDPSLATMGIDPADPGQVSRAADTVSSLFELDPILYPITETKADLRHQFFSQLLETPDFHNLRRSTKLDEVATMITAPKIMAEVAAIEIAVAAGAQKPDDLEMLNRCSDACQQAKQEADTFNDIRDSLGGGGSGCGQGGGSLSALDAKRLAALFRQVSGNTSLRRILNLAGRYRNLAKGRQRKKTKHGRDEVVGVTMGGDISRMLAGELAKLASPEYEWDTMRRLADNAVMVQDLNAVEKIAKGPVMAFIDESGSMGGDRIEHAKAIAISLAWVAKRQKRWCCLCAFSGEDNPDDLRKIVLPPTGWSEDELLQWIIGFDGGGTTIDWLRESSMDKIYRMTKAEQGKTDLLVITDACVSLGSQDIKKSYLQWAGKTNTRLMAIEIAGGGWGYGSEGGDLSLQSICDEYHKVGSLGVEETAVGDVLSI